MIYKIAGLVVKMESFGRTVKQAEPYIYCGDEEVDLVIRSDVKNLLLAQPQLSEDDAEYISTGTCFNTSLLDFQGISIHASAVVMDGKCYIFSASSGVGKSTHTKLWLKAFGKRAYILNDDMPALRFEDGMWYAYGTPWSGRDDCSVNARVPVGGIVLLGRSMENELENINASDAVFMLLKQTIRPKTPEVVNRLLGMIDLLLHNVPVRRIRCNKDISAAIFAYEVMSGKKFTFSSEEGK